MPEFIAIAAFEDTLISAIRRAVTFLADRLLEWAEWYLRTGIQTRNYNRLLLHHRPEDILWKSDPLDIVSISSYAFQG